MTGGRQPLEVYRPTTPMDIRETIEALKDEQRQIAICLQAWLQSPPEALEAAEARLVEARTQEAELLDVIVWNHRSDAARRAKRRQKQHPQGVEANAGI
jgi:hypothetical protein